MYVFGVVGSLPCSCRYSMNFNRSWDTNIEVICKRDPVMLPCAYFRRTLAARPLTMRVKDE